ncbi:Pentatricopeptide repeat [Dillenia turbinata]|uniref:Pentatricopeptide repeat n=1 Tax=Dillenia turbinata TaxID=194707 RepID=A0AAN8W707_9MAGN
MGENRNAEKLFGEIPVKNVVWSIVILGYAKNGFGGKSLELFREMGALGLEPNSYTIVGVLVGVGGLEDLVLAQCVHGLIVKSGLEFESIVGTALLDAYAKCDNVVDSCKLFDQMEKNLVSCNALLTGFAYNDCFEEAVLLFNQLRMAGLVPDSTTLNGHPKEALGLLLEFRVQGIHAIDSVLLVSFLSACGDLALLKLCQQLHCCAFSAGFYLDRSVQNCLISTYSKCGNMELASTVFKDMGYLQDVVSWNTILNRYGINGQGETAVSLYHEMKEHGKVPHSATNLCILGACIHSGLVVDGKRIFSKVVEENRIEVTEEHYGCFIDMLARAGHLLEAWRFMDGLLERVGSLVWRVLLN